MFIVKRKKQRGEIKRIRSVQRVTIEEARGLVERELRHAIGILDEDILSWVGGTFGDVEFNADESANAHLLVDNIIPRAERVRIHLVTEFINIIVITRLSSFELLEASVLLFLHQLNVLVGLLGIHWVGILRAVLFLAVVAPNPLVESRYGIRLPWRQCLLPRLPWCF